ncbi:MAG: hypothetical protein AAF791_01775 [Bacteroidota bacterium]
MGLTEPTSPASAPRREDPRGPLALTWAAWGVCVLGAAAALIVVTAEPQLASRPPSLALVTLPYVLLAALAWWGRVTSTARWVALAGALLVLGLGAALWFAWAEAPLARLSAPRLVPGRQLVAVAVVAYVVSLARRART